MAGSRDFLAEKNWEEEIQPFLLFEKLFFALFGVTGPSDIMISKYLQVHFLESLLECLFRVTFWSHFWSVFLESLLESLFGVPFWSPFLESLFGVYFLESLFGVNFGVTFGVTGPSDIMISKYLQVYCLKAKLFYN